MAVQKAAGVLFVQGGCAGDSISSSGSFRSPQIELISYTPETANSYATIRAGQRVSPADAIHLASASNVGVDRFLTNDHRLLPLVIPGINFIAGMDVNLF
jgi:hypothetical protein